MKSVFAAKSSRAAVSVYCAVMVLAATWAAGEFFSGVKIMQRMPSLAAANALIRPSCPPPRMPRVIVLGDVEFVVFAMGLILDHEWIQIYTNVLFFSSLVFWRRFVFGFL